VARLVDTSLQRYLGKPGERGKRDPATELYDEACALLEAAQVLQAAAGLRRSAPAIATSFGCLEAALEALGTEVAVMPVAARAPTARARPACDSIDPEELRIRTSFDQLARGLSASRSSCAAVRELVGPVLANR
jgi:hypothetical protein